MNTMLVRGQWNQVRGEFANRWAMLTGNRLGRLNGRMLKMVGRTQVKFGRTKAAAGKKFRRMVGR